MNIEQIEHSLSRLALAKAIKTPGDNEVESEPWSKSIIFNQPFIKELKHQRHLLQKNQIERRQQPVPDLRKKEQINMLRPQLQERKSRHRDTQLEIKRQPPTQLPQPSPTEKRLSELSFHKKKRASHMSSNMEKTEEFTSEKSDGPESFKKTNKPSEQPRRPASAYQTVNQNSFRPSSFGSKEENLSGFSRGSDSSATSPSTESESKILEETQHQWHSHTSIEKLPNPKTNRRKPVQPQNIASPPMMEDYHRQQQKQKQQYKSPNISETNPVPTYSMQYPAVQEQRTIPTYSVGYSPAPEIRPISMNPMDSINLTDSMYYQTLQQYQNQLYLQQQLQHQQQMYVLSQNPSAFFPPGSRVIDQPTASPSNNGNRRHHSDKLSRSNSVQYLQSKPSKVSATDLRRRSDMIKIASESPNRHISNYFSHQNNSLPVISPVNHRHSSGAFSSYNL